LPFFAFLALRKAVHGIPETDAGGGGRQMRLLPQRRMKLMTENQ
jgi:hypothetical protein